MNWDAVYIALALFGGWALLMTYMIAKLSQMWRE